MLKNEFGRIHAIPFKGGDNVVVKDLEVVFRIECAFKPRKFSWARKSDASPNYHLSSTHLRH